MTERYQGNLYRNIERRSCEGCKLRHFALCRPLSVKQIHQLRPRLVSLEARRKLYYEGGCLTNTYTLRAGCMILYRFLRNGKRHIAWIALPGDFLGMPLMRSDFVRYSVLAVTACDLCGFTFLTEAAQRWPALALRIVALCTEIMEIQNDYLTFIAQGSARERVAFLVLDLYERLWKRGMLRGNRIPFPLTQEDIADTLGISTVHVNRVLHQLAREGLLIIKRHEIMILDYPRLSEVVDFNVLRPGQQRLIHP